MASGYKPSPYEPNLWVQATEWSVWNQHQCVWIVVMWNQHQCVWIIFLFQDRDR